MINHIVAPEVALGDAYDARCDVYSFALLLWEIMNLRKPYGYVSMEKLKRLVWDKNNARRPHIRVVPEELAPDEQSTLFLTSPEASWTAPLKRLVERAWSHDFIQRPTMAEMELELKAQLTKCIEHMDRVHGGLDDNFLDSRRLSHNRRRSTFVYYPPFRDHDRGVGVRRRGESGILEAQAKIQAWFAAAGGGSSRRMMFSRRSLLNIGSGLSFTNRRKKMNHPHHDEHHHHDEHPAPLRNGSNDVRIFHEVGGPTTTASRLPDVRE